MTEDTAKSITLTSDDGDPEVAQVLTYAIAMPPQHGTRSGLNASTGQVTYSPEANYNGSDSVTFTVTDDASAGSPANLTSAATTVNLTVTPVNDAPAANVQSVTTTEDTAQSLTLAGEDGDPEVAQVLTYAIATPSQHGTQIADGGAMGLNACCDYDTRIGKGAILADDETNDWSSPVRNSWEQTWPISRRPRTPRESTRRSWLAGCPAAADIGPRPVKSA